MAEKLQAMEGPDETAGWEEDKKPRAAKQATENKDKTGMGEESKQEPDQSD
jgi:hypothetical protein